MILQNKEWRACASMANYWKAHKPVRFIRSYVLSGIQQYKHRTTWKAPLQSIMKNTEDSLVKHAPISQCEKAITSRFQQYQTHFIKLSCEKCLCNICVLYWSHYRLTANHHLYTWLWRKNEGSKGFEGSTMKQALYLLQLQLVKRHISSFTCLKA